ncbi:Oncosphere antigen A [Taenia solium]
MASHRDSISADEDVPQNVQMKPIDPNTVSMTWDAPRISNGYVTGYHVRWQRDDGKNGSVNASLSRIHVFTDLEPGQTISATVAAVFRKNDSTTPEYIGTYSGRVIALTPYSMGEGSSSSSAATTTAGSAYSALDSITLFTSMIIMLTSTSM